MELQGAVCVVTGGANGIGRALATRFVAEGASVIIVDREAEAAEAVAATLGANAGSLGGDVAVQGTHTEAVAMAEHRFGPVDLYCSNAGVGGGGGIDMPDQAWQQLWDINLMAHVYAAREVLPSMLERGRGWLLNTASAAGLLTNIANADYTVTKHAAVGLAEWLAITYGDRGIGVSCLCPMGVATDMVLGNADDPAVAAVVAHDLLTPQAVADAVVAGLAEGRFLILPHPEVATMWERKAADPDRWLAGMRRFQVRLLGDG